jgi:hypothetical protein
LRTHRMIVAIVSLLPQKKKQKCKISGEQKGGYSLLWMVTCLITLSCLRIWIQKSDRWIHPRTYITAFSFIFYLQRLNLFFSRSSLGNRIL